ncbi:MAG: DUF3426 domain-containing protein [Methyloglobulus sp.]|nr:DUF3426 domain-containing protein [Methyloglobulus sp.]
MITQCPDCRKTYPLTQKQLQANLSVFCTDCDKEFNALELLSEKVAASKTAPETKAKAKKKPKSRQATKKNLPINLDGWPDVKDLELQLKKPAGLLAEATAEFIPKAESAPKNYLQVVVDGWRQAKMQFSAAIKKHDLAVPATGSGIAPSTTERLPWEAEKIPVNINWSLGFILGCVVLFGQIIYFESGNWSQNPSYRPIMEKFCKYLGCTLRDYDHLDELAVLKGSFISKADDTIVFRAVISNQALFKQHLPSIKLSLLDYNEKLFAQRVFTPKEYVGAHKDYFLPSDSTLEIKLSIAMPRTPVGGYYFDLIH